MNPIEVLIDHDYEGERVDKYLSVIFPDSSRAALQKAFGTIDRIMRAAPEELARVEGIGPQLAARIHTYFEDL